MTSKDEPYPDPLIDEVRRRRRELFAECDDDLEKLIRAIQRRQAEHPDQVVDRRRRKATRQ